MYPFLIKFTLFGTQIKLPSYGIFLAIAFSSAYFVGLWRAKKLGEDPKHVENLFLWIVFGSVLGSRLFHVFFEEPDYYAAHPDKIIAVWEGGYTLYGALLSCLLVVFLYTRTQKVHLMNFFDIAANGTALGIGIGRIGCFLAGCCWGKPTQCFLGVTFSHPETFASIKNTPVHPSQLYEALGAFLIFSYLQWRFKDRKYPGQIFLHGLSLYAFLRFLIEYFRGDEYRGYVFSGLISYSQLVSLAILPVTLSAIYYFSRSQNSKN